MMKVSICRPLDLGTSEIQMWRSFQRQSDHLQSAFLTPEFARVMSRRQPSTRVAVVEEGGKTVAFFPFENLGLKVGRALCYGMSDAQGIVHSPVVQLNGLNLIQACGLDIWEFDHLIGNQLQLFSPQQCAIRNSPAIDLTDGYENWLSRKKPDKIKKILQRENRLEREQGTIEFTYDSKDHNALNLLMKWKSTQYRRTGRKDRFADLWFADSVSELLDTRSENFIANLSILRVKNREVALHLSLCSNGVMADWIPAHDTEFSRYGVGLILRLRVLKAAAENGIYLHDAGAGEEEYKLVFSDYNLKVAKGSVNRPTIAAFARRLQTYPATLATDVVLASPHLRKAARTSLAWIGSMRPDRKSD
jgi:CelD/BcsL family acetyltransferase involved in cellulose biosynthesis